MLDFFFLKMAFVHFPQKDGHSSNQTMSSSFSFAAQLHRKGMLKIKIKKQKTKTFFNRRNVFKGPCNLQCANPCELSLTEEASK